ncbi:Rho GTPase-activating protein 5-like protein [Tanacetum coccineum]
MQEGEDSEAMDRVKCSSSGNWKQFPLIVPITIVTCEGSSGDLAIKLFTLENAAFYVQDKHLNKMNSHNIVMVFAPNMTQMVDPLTALMYAVKVMNVMKTLINKTLRDSEILVIKTYTNPPQEPSVKNNGNQGPRLSLKVQENCDENEEREHSFTTDDDRLDYATTSEESEGSTFCRWPTIKPKTTTAVKNTYESKTGQSSVQGKT